MYFYFFYIIDPLLCSLMATDTKDCPRRLVLCRGGMSLWLNVLLIFNSSIPMIRRKLGKHVIHGRVASPKPEKNKVYVKKLPCSPTQEKETIWNITHLTGKEPELALKVYLYQQHVKLSLPFMHGVDPGTKFLERGWIPTLTHFVLVLPTL